MLPLCSPSFVIAGQQDKEELRQSFGCWPSAGTASSSGVARLHEAFAVGMAIWHSCSGFLDVDGTVRRVLFDGGARTVTTVRQQRRTMYMV
jgi:hypothetical protein